MNYRKLGSSDLEVSEIALGSWLTYSGGDRVGADARLHGRGVRGGLNFFDTANAYGRGAAESAWGEILSSRPARLLHPRDEGVGADVGRPRRPRPVCRADRQADRRVARSGYGPTTSTYTRRTASIRTSRSRRPIEPCGRSSPTGRRGISASASGPPEQIQAAIDLAGADLFVSSQPQYSMLWRAPEPSSFRCAPRNGISQIVWSPLAQGLLDRQVPPRRAAARPTPARRASEMGSVHGGVHERPTLEAVEACGRSPIAPGYR